jgi:hypothetical protein
MIHFLITGQSFEGSFSLRYNDAGRFVGSSIDAELSDKQLRFVCEHTPAFRHEVEEWCKRSNLKFVEHIDEPEFSDFYDAFGNKVGRHKAENVWNRITKSDRIKAFVYISQYKSWLKVNPGIAHLHPATYLNQKRWED